MQYSRRDSVTHLVAEHVTDRQDYKGAILSLIVFDLCHDSCMRPSRYRLHCDILRGGGDGGWNTHERSSR